jgi:purine catabolism regulator
MVAEAPPENTAFVRKRAMLLDDRLSTGKDTTLALSIDELAGLPHLRLAVRAGACGTAEKVAWAQASDLDAPWDWATGGELLMKNGRTLPPTAAGQVALLRSLAEHDIAGLVIGMDPDTPPLHTEAIAVADELRLPVLSAPYSVSFAAIGRAVADASKADEGHRLALTERVYNTIRRSVAQPRGDAMRQLARDLACRLAVVDADTGQSVLDGAEPVPAELRDEVVKEVNHRGGALPGVVHLDIDGARAQLVEVPDEDPTVLVTYGFRAAPPDIVLLAHIATAAALLLAQQGIRREHQRRIGGELLAHLVDGRLDNDEGHRQLADRGLSADRCVLLAVDGGSPSGEQYVHLSLDRRTIPNLLLRRAGRLYALVPQGEEAIDVLHRRLGEAALIGVSDPLGSPGRAAAALREANWAVRDAVNSSDGVSHYAQAMLFSVLRDVDEAQLLVDRVLGALLRYDAERSTDLTNTLDTFLRCGRSWQLTAALARIHRQTVVYRIRRVEEITGRDLSLTAHIAEMWLALRARDLVADPASTARSPV